MGGFTMSTNCNFGEVATYIQDDLDNITIGTMIEELENYNEWYEVVKYNIKENFQRMGLRQYSVLNLDGEIKNRMATFFDGEDVMLEEYHVLNMFQVLSVQSVIRNWVAGSGKCTYILEFKDGQVQIESEFP
jgi:hypothetical protein